MTKRIPWRTPAAIVVLGLLGWVGFEIGRAGGDISPPHIASQSTLNHGVITGKRVDGRSWSLDYDHATMSPDGTQATIAHVHNGRLHRRGKPDVLFKADDVTANTATSDFTVRGAVNLTEELARGRRRTFTTTGAQYVGLTHTLILPNSVTIVDGPTTISVANATVDFRTGATTLGRIVGVKP
ncbi:MAG TPA: hypothetical protein VE591_00205 [Candidatus Acidoferrum sp.]|nr:hypothetical protein [Candidatus Acidoferrum sp.]